MDSPTLKSSLKLINYASKDIYPNGTNPISYFLKSSQAFKKKKSWQVSYFFFLKKSKTMTHFPKQISIKSKFLKISIAVPYYKIAMIANFWLLYSFLL